MRHKIAAGAILFLSSAASAATLIDLTAIQPGSVSVPRGVNNNGVVAGSIIFGSGNAFYYDSSFHQLVSPTGHNSDAQAINSSGIIVGSYDIDGSGTQHAFRYDTSMHDLGALGSQSIALAVNDSGITVGWTNVGTARHPFMYDTSMHDLGTLGGTYAYAQFVNNAGQIAGISTVANGDSHFFRYDSSLHDLGNLGGTGANINDMNAGGIIVGSANSSSPLRHAVYVDSSAHDMGTLGGSESEAYAINNSGKIVGGSNTAGDAASLPFIYDLATHSMNPLGNSNGTATDINNLNQVVGNLLLPGNIEHAFIFQNNTLTDLNTLVSGPNGSTLQSAFAISDSGYIIGTLSNNQVYLLTLPEPTTALLLAAPALLFLRTRRRPT